jgi:alpha-glucosidase
MTPPSELALDARFERFASAGGLAIVALDDVDDDALQVTCERTLTLLSARPDVHETMVEEGATVVVVDQEASLADVPELSSVEDPELSTYRSYGAERNRPVMVIGEENLLCLPDNPYAGESLFVHAFAHTVLSLGIEPLEPDFTARLQATYESAVDEGRWQETFAITTPRQYFAEGVQSYFSVNDEASPANGVHNDVNTGPELEAYDPQLYALIGEYFGPSVTIPLCPEAP